MHSISLYENKNGWLVVVYVKTSRVLTAQCDDFQQAIELMHYLKGERKCA